MDRQQPPTLPHCGAEVSDGEWVGYDDVETVCAKLQFAQHLGFEFMAGQPTPLTYRPPEIRV